MSEGGTRDWRVGDLKRNTRSPPLVGCLKTAPVVGQSGREQAGGRRALTRCLHCNWTGSRGLAAMSLRTGRLHPSQAREATPSPAVDGTELQTFQEPNGNSIDNTKPHRKPQMQALAVLQPGGPAQRGLNPAQGDGRWADSADSAEPMGRAGEGPG